MMKVCAAVIKKDTAAMAMAIVQDGEFAMVEDKVMMIEEAMMMPDIAIMLVFITTEEEVRMTKGAFTMTEEAAKMKKEEDQRKEEAAQMKEGVVNFVVGAVLVKGEMKNTARKATEGLVVMKIQKLVIIGKKTMREDLSGTI